MKPQRYEIDEPDLKPITNCINGKIEITPEICKKFWDYRADSGHLWHLLFDLVGEDFVTTHRQDESIRKVLEEWDAHSNATEDKVLDDIAQYIQKHSWISSPGFITAVSQKPLLVFIQSLRTTPTPPAGEQR